MRDNTMKNLKGIILCLIIAISSWILGKKFEIIGGASCWAGISIVSLILQRIMGIW